MQRNLDVVCAVADQHDVLQSIAVEISHCDVAWTCSGVGGDVRHIRRRRLTLQVAPVVGHRVRRHNVRLAVAIEIQVNKNDFFVADALTKGGLRWLTSID